MSEFEKILANIEASLVKDKSEHSSWNANYFKMQKSRYLEDLNFYKGLKGVNKVLEVGAAPFHLSLCLQEFGYDLTVLDINPKRFQWFIDENKLQVKQCNVEIDELDVEDNSFDLIIFTEIFEHLRINPINTLLKLNKKLKEGGLLYLTTPNFFRYTNIVNFLLGRPVVNAYYEFEKLNTIGHMGHVREYAKDEVSLFIENTGFEIIDFDYKQSRKFPKYSKANLSTIVFKATKTHMKFLAKKNSK
jgi:2-polyprenyl-3-methyl-5-hydroxy-6-metoxy-1,4-benzoquinol methylase